MGPLEPTKVEAQVEKVVDGDTVHVTINDKIEKLRLLGIDTEESHNDNDIEHKQTQIPPVKIIVYLN